MFGAEPTGLGDFIISLGSFFKPVHGLFFDEDSDFCKMSCHCFIVLCSVSEIIAFDAKDLFTYFVISAQWQNCQMHPLKLAIPLGHFLTKLR